jgi:thioredoxin 1
VELTKENFEEVITNNDTVVVDYWADWCGPCKSFGPIFEKVSEGFPNAVFAKVDTEKEQEIASWFNIRSIPTLSHADDIPRKGHGLLAAGRITRGCIA